MFYVTPLLVVDVSAELLVPRDPPVEVTSAPPYPVPCVDTFKGSDRFFVRGFVTVDLPISSGATTTGTTCA